MSSRRRAAEKGLQISNPDKVLYPAGNARCEKFDNSVRGRDPIGQLVLVSHAEKLKSAQGTPMCPDDLLVVESAPE